MEQFIGSLVFVKSNDLICQVEKKWFEQKVLIKIDIITNILELIYLIQFKNDPTEYQPIKSIEVMNALRDYARKLYEQDIQNYNSCKIL